MMETFEQPKRSEGFETLFAPLMDVKVFVHGACGNGRRKLFEVAAYKPCTDIYCKSGGINGYVFRIGRFCNEPCVFDCFVGGDDGKA